MTTRLRHWLTANWQTRGLPGVRSSQLLYTEKLVLEPSVECRRIAFERCRTSRGVAESMIITLQRRTGAIREKWSCDDLFMLDRQSS